MALATDIYFLEVLEVGSLSSRCLPVGLFLLRPLSFVYRYRLLPFGSQCLFSVYAHPSISVSKFPLLLICIYGHTVQLVGS